MWIKPFPLWLLVLFLWGCVSAVSNYPTPEGVSSPAPLKTPVEPCAQTPAPLLIYFIFPDGPCSQLYSYDERVPDVFAFPGAGRGVRAPSVAPKDSVVFERNFRIFRYFPSRECLLYYNTEGGFAFVPFIDGQETLYALVSECREEAERGIGDLLIIPQSEPCRIIRPSSINAAARLHGGITSFGVSDDGHLLAFTTKDERLFICELWAQAPLWVLDTGIQNAAGVDVDKKGGLIAWTDVLRNRIFITAPGNWAEPCVLITPTLTEATMSSPRFKGLQPDYVTYRETTPDGLVHRFAYDLCLGLRRTLTILLR